MLSVQFYYTDEFADVTSDPVAYIQGLVDSANTVYNKSKVPLQMYARCFTRLSSVKESNDAIDTLTKFRNSQGKTVLKIKLKIPRKILTRASLKCNQHPTYFLQCPTRPCETRPTWRSSSCRDP